jgi:hypothetical protein
LLPVVVAHNEASGQFLDGPRWWEATGGHKPRINLALSDALYYAHCGARETQA